MSSGVIYEIEGDLDFFKELKNMTSKKEDTTSMVLQIDEEDKQTSKCLITDERLRKDHVTLKCGHKFNYIPLFKEVVFQKYSLLPKNVSSSIVTTYTKNTTPQSHSSASSASSSATTIVHTPIVSHSSNATTSTSYGSQQSSNLITVMYNSSYNLETTKVGYNEIKCPYCRSITPNILPYYPYSEVSKIKYVNIPSNLALPALLCEYPNPINSAKENTCKTCCVYYEKYDMMLCNKHFNKLESEATLNAQPKTTRRKTKLSEVNVNDENVIISHHNPATSVCSFTLLSGPRKGCPCGKPMWIPKMSDTNTIQVTKASASVFCKVHYYKGNL